MREDHDFTPQQRQIITGLRRASWFLALIFFFACLVVFTPVMYSPHIMGGQGIDWGAKLIVSLISGIAAFSLTRISIWVLKGFWKKVEE